MNIPHWNPTREKTPQEEAIFARLTRNRKLFAFLRDHRHEILDEGFQVELDAMYRGSGKTPVPPALMAMAVLLQGYVGASDAEAVELTVVDLRWQLVLGRLGAPTPAFSQGALHKFRQRLIRTDMDRRLLERTRELAQKTKEFDWKKLPESLRVAIDSRPLVGAGRVEDTFNLLGHAARKIAEGAAVLCERTFEDVCRRAGMPLLLASSVKAGVDVNWSDPEAKEDALNVLVEQVTSLSAWVARELPGLAVEEPLTRYIVALAQVQAQDLETSENGRTTIRQGVAVDRRISIEDAEMRHGRKSKSKRFDGFKEHIATDLDTGLVTACAVTPANRPEEEGAPPLAADMKNQGLSVGSLAIDRAYVNSSLVQEVLAAGGEVVCKPWAARNISGDFFTKADFKINIRDRTITCPAGEVESFEFGRVVEFEPEACGQCSRRSECTMSASGKGRTVKIAEDEQLQQRLRKLQATGPGRERLRERTAVEHSLAHIAGRKGPRARYRGSRKNQFDLRRAATIQNLETIQRKQEEGACRAA